MWKALGAQNFKGLRQEKESSKEFDLASLFELVVGAFEQVL